ncbi:hypothetical protein [Curtobacterium sp. MCBD17_040]|uniref:hypothetical protein n=1 Tax=Curtobacterium sp. MCBD17_040 TaxID=2175674 RepID=UPI000DA93F01|nr:hypothetical protein [Curtobacterium sp. MCBD17_040]WIB65448.1 hypothetical protein DEI94_18870 [Curtobacterium sp. MCBD17_040]
MNTHRLRSTRGGTIFTVVAGTALLLLGTTACSTTTPHSYAEACVAKTTHKRVADSNCSATPSTSGDAAFLWYFYPYGATVPAVGSSYGSGTKSIPSGSSVTTGIPSTGGAVSKSGAVGSADEEDDEQSSTYSDPDEDENSGGGSSVDEDENSGGGSSVDEDEEENSFSSVSDDDE